MKKVLRSIIEWAQQLIGPVDMVRGLLRKKYQDNLGKLIWTVWTLPITLSLAIDAIAFHAYGIEVKSQFLEFTLPYLTIQILKLFLEAALIHAILVVLRLNSRMGVVFACYSIIVIYMPVDSFLDLPYAYSSFSLLAQLKAQHLGLIETYYYFVNHNHEIAKNLINWPASMNYVISSVGGSISMLLTVLLAECLTQILCNDRFWTYVAVCLALWIDLVPAILYRATELLLMFSYMGSPA